MNPGKPAVFLDRDGTIIEDRGALRAPSDVVFISGAIESLARLAGLCELFIITNQRAVADGELTAEDVSRVNAHVVSTLADAGAPVRDVYVCPHRREDGCECIKPKPHFLRRAAEEHGIDLRRSFSVGDHPHDAELAALAGGRGIYVLTGHGQKHRDELALADVAVAPALPDAVELILAAIR